MPRRKGDCPVMNKGMLVAVKGAASILIPAGMLEKYAEMGYTVYPVKGRDANEARRAAAENEGAVTQ